MTAPSPVSELDQVMDEARSASVVLSILPHQRSLPDQQLAGHLEGYLNNDLHRLGVALNRVSQLPVTINPGSRRQLQRLLKVDPLAARWALELTFEIHALIALTSSQARRQQMHQVLNKTLKDIPKDPVARETYVHTSLQPMCELAGQYRLIIGTSSPSEAENLLEQCWASLQHCDQTGAHPCL